MTAMKPRYGLQTKQKIRARIDISGSTMKALRLSNIPACLFSIQKNISLHAMNKYVY